MLVYRRLGVHFLQLFLQFGDGLILLLQLLGRLFAGRFLPGDILLQLPDLGLVRGHASLNVGCGGPRVMMSVRFGFGVIHAGRPGGNGYKQAQRSHKKPTTTHYR
jgi:hypothetical protein